MVLCCMILPDCFCVASVDCFRGSRLYGSELGGLSLARLREAERARAERERGFVTLRSAASGRRVYLPGQSIPWRGFGVPGVSLVRGVVGQLAMVVDDDDEVGEERKRVIVVLAENGGHAPAHWTLAECGSSDDVFVVFGREIPEYRGPPDVAAPESCPCLGQCEGGVGQ